jgi:hypothetical protein
MKTLPNLWWIWQENLQTPLKLELQSSQERYKHGIMKTTI